MNKYDQSLFIIAKNSLKIWDLCILLASGKMVSYSIIENFFNLIYFIYYILAPVPHCHHYTYIDIIKLNIYE